MLGAARAARRGSGALACLGIGVRAMAVVVSLLVLLGSGYAGQLPGFQSNITHVDAITPGHQSGPAGPRRHRRTRAEHPAGRR